MSCKLKQEVLNNINKMQEFTIDDITDMSDITSLHSRVSRIIWSLVDDGIIRLREGPHTKSYHCVSAVFVKTDA